MNLPSLQAACATLQLWHIQRTTPGVTEFHGAEDSPSVYVVSGEWKARFEKFIADQNTKETVKP